METQAEADAVAHEDRRERRRTLVRILALTAAGALCLAGLVSIGIFLFGTFGETETRLLATALAVAGYSLTGLAATMRVGRRPFWLAPLGIGVSSIAFGLMVVLIWSDPEGDLLGRAAGSVTVVAVAIAHASLLLPRHADQRAAKAVLAGTLAASTVLATMLVVLMLFALEPGERYLRWLGVFAVLTVLGTLLVPLLRKMTGRPGTPIVAAGQAVGTAAETPRLTIQFRGRTFDVDAAYREQPRPGYWAEIWESTSGGRAPVSVLLPIGPEQDPYSVMALAVLRLTRAVGSGDASSLLPEPPR
jgi:hypothetical protein